MGCVPKKVMYNTSHVNEVLHEAKHFGFTVGDVSFDWAAIKKSRDRYVQRLNGIYESGLDKLNIQRYSGFAAFSGPNTVVIDGTATVTAKHILIAVGGAPTPLGKIFFLPWRIYLLLMVSSQ